MAQEVKFGTGGWRAIIGDGFTKDNVRKLTSALASKILAEGVDDKPVVIGYDRRFLSDLAVKWAAEVLIGAGIEVHVIKREAPTPLVMYTVKRDSLSYGMAVTASHNPAEYNGIKVFIEGGRDADQEATEDLERYLEKVPADEAIPSVPYEEALDDGRAKIINPFNDYIDSILNQIDMQKIRDAALYVILDPMFGVSRTSLQTILLTTRCEVDVIHDRRDTLFGGRLPSPNTKTLNALTDNVLESGADIGIATDGDADRLGIIDDQGGFLHPNQILVLLYYYLVKYKGWKGPVVRNVATTHMLDKVADLFGETCYEVPVGFKHISSKMIETNAVIGGESSGGLTVRGHISGKDGIYAGSLLVEMIAVVGKPLSAIYEEIVGQFKPLFMVENDFRFAPQDKQKINHVLFEEKKLPAFDYKISRVSYEDGCKVYFENGGWIICRFSGTEPLIRIFCEMPSTEEAEKTSEVMQGFLAL